MDELLNRFDSISLEQMSGIRLMNRIDTKFVTTMPVLEQLLAMAVDEYMAQEIEGERNLKYSTTYSTPTSTVTREDRRYASAPT